MLDYVIQKWACHDKIQKRFMQRAILQSSLTAHAITLRPSLMNLAFNFGMLCKK